MHERLSSTRAVGIDYDRVVVLDYGKQKRNVSALFDASTGTLLKVVLTKPSRETVRPASLALDTDEQVLFRRWVCFKGYPEIILVPLFSVINNCPHTPTEAARITAGYVTDSCYHNHMKLAWLIAVTDHPPEPGHPWLGVSDSVVYRDAATRFVIGFDGTTGQLLWSASFQ